MAVDADATHELTSVDRGGMTADLRWLHSRQYGSENGFSLQSGGGAEMKIRPGVRYHGRLCRTSVFRYRFQSERMVSGLELCLIPGQPLVRE